MGGSKESSEQQQTTQAGPAPYETELNKLQYEQLQAADPYQRQVNQSALSRVNDILTGKQLPGNLSQLQRGIDPEVTTSIVNQSLSDLNQQLAGSGAGTFLESGASQSIGARSAADIRRAAEEFNIGSLFNLLNLGVGGQAQVQQPILGTSQVLSQRLAGLRPVTSSGTTTNRGANPFLQSFQTSAGQGLGNVFNPQTYIGRR